MNISLQTDWYLLIFCFIGLLITFLFSYKQLRFSPIAKAPLWSMEILRIIIMVLIAFTLLRPEIVTVITELNEPEVVILQDISNSMQTQDLVIDGKELKIAVKRSDWVDTQIKNKFYKPLEKKYKVYVESFAMPPASDGEVKTDGTDFKYAFNSQLSNYKNLRAIILLSDGGWNFGGSPIGIAAKLRANATPIYSIATGSGKYLPDLILERVKTPAFCLADEKIAIPFQIQSRMDREIRTKITLSSEYGIENSKEILISPHDSYHDSIIWQPKKIGNYNLVLDIPVEDGELISDNNRFVFNIAVKRELLKVLIVESFPRWEYRYLRNALMRDPGVEVKTLLFHPGMEVGGGKNYIDKFPTKDQITGYDVIFLGDVGLGHNELTEENIKLVEGVVKHQGTGVVFLPGYRGKHLTFENTILNNLYPVLLDKNRPEGISSGIPASMELSAVGRDHFLMLLADNPEANSAVWRNLPGFCWNAAVVKSRVGSHVLALHSGLRSGGSRMPLIVIREYGHGNVLFMGSDSAWKWRKGVEDKYHYRFWGQVVRWMAHKRHLADSNGVRCFFAPEKPLVNKRVFIYVAAHDRLGRPIDDAVVNIDINHNTKGQNISFQMNQDKRGWGVYNGSFTPGFRGSYDVTVTLPEKNAKLELQLNVLGEILEKVGDPVKITNLNELATITKGEVFMPEDIDKLISKINALPKKVEIEKRYLLWAQWWWGLLIILLLTAYWSLRKLYGLL